VRKATRLPQYGYKERTFRVTKESTPEGVLVKAQKWLSSQSSKAAVGYRRRPLSTPWLWFRPALPLNFFLKDR
jgi:hypothetical protein